MATTTLTRPRTTFPRQRWVGIGIALVVLGIIAALVINSMSGSAASTTFTTTTVTRGTIVASVAGSGSVAASQSLDLAFQTSGTVTEVLAQEGNSVALGQVLARLDDRALQLDVANAQASLLSAQARLTQIQQGNATTQQLAASEASVASAAANLTKARTGNTTAADIASAQAGLRSAQAKLDALKSPTPDKVSTAQLKLTQAQNSLQSTRDSASATKTRAELDMRKAVESLTQAQSSYATALQQWQHVQDQGTDPLNPTTTNGQGQAVKNGVNDAQSQQYYDAYVRAEASMRSAEQALTQAQVSFDNARQQEVVDVQNAEAQLADAQQQLAALINPSQADIIQAQASVDQAAASLRKLQQGGTAADVAVAQASVDQAQANLEQLTAPATETDLTIQQAAVAQAEQAVKQAELNLENATLRAPFAGVISSVTIVPGSSATGGANAAFTLVDRSTLHVDLRLSENDVAKIQLDQPVTVTIDALDNWTVQGIVSYIAPAAETSSGVVTYAVRVSFQDADARVKVGMTADLTITTAQNADVLLVPNSALLPKGAGRVVQVPSADGTITSEVEVQTGLTDGTQTEVISGLKDGDKVVTTPSTAAPASGGGLFGR